MRLKTAVLLGLVSLTGFLAGATAYLWHQTTYLPAWYRPADEAVGSSDPATEADPLSLPADSAGQQAVTLTADQINQLVVDTLAQQPQAEQLLSVAKDINTSIEADRIESGMVVNLSQLPPNLLPPEGQKLINQMTQVMPILADRDVYVSLSMRPTIEQGRLVLDDNTVLSVGRYQVPLSQITEQFGLSPQVLEEQLATALQQQGIRLEDIQLTPGQLTVTGSAQ